MTENMDVKLDLMSSSGLRVIEQTKKRLFSPAQKEKIKRRSLMQAGVTETSEGENEPGLYRGRRIGASRNQGSWGDQLPQRPHCFKPSFPSLNSLRTS